MIISVLSSNRSYQGLKFILAFLVLIAASMLVNPDQAHADCGVPNNNDHDQYAGVFVDLLQVPYGTTKPIQANSGAGLGVKISTVQPTDTPEGNIVQLAPNDHSKVLSRRLDSTFALRETGVPGGGANCKTGVTDNIVVVLGYGVTSWPTDVASQSWALDCDMSIHPNYAQAFIFEGTGVPDGRRAGGTWTKQRLAPPNGWTVAYSLIYYEPPPKQTISGRVYNKTTGTGVPGVTIGLCTTESSAGAYQATVTDANGNWSVTLEQWKGFCVRIIKSGDTTLTSKPDPGDTGNRIPPDWVIPSSGFTNNNPERATNKSYEWQLAGIPCYQDSGCGSSYRVNDRNVDSGFDFAYQSKDVTNIKISGRVYNSSTGVGLNNVTIDLCSSRTVKTRSDGTWEYYLPQYTPFCARIADDSVVPGDWYKPTTGFTNNNPEHNTSGTYTYEWQLPGADCYKNVTYCGAGKIGNNDNYLTWDRKLDSGFDFKYVSTTSTPTCSTSTSPANIEINQLFTLTVTISRNGSAVAPSGNMYVVIKIPGGTLLSYTLGYTDSGSGAASASISNLKFGTAGTYYVSVTADGYLTPISGCDGSVGDGFSIANSPYHKVYGGDVMAGKGIDANGNCVASGVGDAGIIGWHDRPNNKGAGTQLATMALGLIQSFASGQTKDPSTPNYLTFANSTGGDYGGNMGDLPCPANYYQPPSGASTLALSSINIGSSDSGERQRSGDLTITGGTIGIGKRVTIYVDGNVKITNNIQYSNLSPYSSISDIPSFRLIVKGNIYVTPGVTILDGLYVTRGTFYTCAATLAFDKPTQSDLDIGCHNNNLTVFGAIIADLIKFNRTGGTLGESLDNETRNSGNPAEKFIYTPEMWLTSDFNNDGGNIDSMRSLPPML